MKDIIIKHRVASISLTSVQTAINNGESVPLDVIQILVDHIENLHSQQEERKPNVQIVGVGNPMYKAYMLHPERSLTNDEIKAAKQDHPNQLLESKVKEIHSSVRPIDHLYINTARRNINDVEFESLIDGKPNDHVYTTIGLYVNGSYKINGVKLEHLRDHINYNMKYRFGRALFVDGICVYIGIVDTSTLTKFINTIQMNGMRLTECTKPYK